MKKLFIIAMILIAIPSFAQDNADKDSAVDIGIQELSRLVEKTGIATIDMVKDLAPKLWEITYIKTIMSAKINLCYYILLMIFCLIAMFFVWYFAVRENYSDEVIPFCVFSTVFLVIVFIMIMGSGLNSIKTLYAPDYYTLQEIIKLIK